MKDRKTWILRILGIIMCLIYGGAMITFKDMRRVLIMLGMCNMLFIYLYVNRGQRSLETLSDRLQDLINHPGESKPEYEMSDTMESKIEGQVRRLIDMGKVREEEMETKSQAISSLVSDIGHQLRTPLSNLNMYFTFLSDSQPEASKENEEIRRKLSDQVAHQIDKLNWLMDGLMKVSKVEAGLIQIREQEESIQSTLLKAIGQSYLSAETKGINIDLEGTLDELLFHDSKWTSEAIFNILDNGIKYSSSGTTIKIKGQAYESFFRVDIRDEGQGIEEKELNLIFKRFHRSPGNRRDVDGVGIGLYLAREIITRQGGYIKVTSQVDVGSLFSIFLPRLSQPKIRRGGEAHGASE